MYYLDFHKVYRYTTKDQRVLVRKQLVKNRDAVMELRLKHQRGLCFYCADPIDMTAHLDHLVPIYYGGDNRLRNLVAACRVCNMTKLADQIEITNPYTIADYLKKQEAYKKWKVKYSQADERGRRKLKRYMPKRVQLYKVHRADLFRYVKG